MSSTVQRERAAARAKLERQMAEKLEIARKRKQRNTALSAFGVLLLLAGIVFWVVKMIGPGKDKVVAEPPAQTPGPTQCTYSAEDAKANPALKNVGTPEAGAATETGKQTMTITTGLGVIEVEVNTAKAPCTARSMTFLASKKFFDGTKCHRLTTAGIKVLQCGNPSTTGDGGPTYKFAEENMPNVIDPKAAYPVGTIAMANAGAGSTGSQFFIVYGESSLPQNYTALGKVTKGLDLVVKAAEAGAVDKTGKKVDDGKPKTEVVIKSLTMTPATKS